MDTQKFNLWNKVKPWLIILSAIPAAILLLILLQIISGILIGLFTGTEIMNFNEIIKNYPILWQINSIVVQLLAFFLVVRFYWVNIFKNNFVSIGFEKSGLMVKELVLGFFTGVFLLGVIFIILLAGKQIEITAVHFSFKYFFLYIFIYALVAFNEELVFRGYLLGTTMKMANKYTVLLLFAALFSLAHFLSNDFAVLPIINIFLAGIILGIYYIHTRRLWFSISLHFIWNFLQGPVFGSNVSGNVDEHTIVTQRLLGQTWLTGGDFGFEGSIIMTAVLIPLILFLEFYLRKQKKA